MSNGAELCLGALYNEHSNENDILTSFAPKLCCYYLINNMMPGINTLSEGLHCGLTTVQW